MKQDYTIFIDSGHGITTELKQKFSPRLNEDMNIPKVFTSDGRFREGRFNRDIAKDLVASLKGLGYDARMLVTEEKEDVSLAERCRRVNAVCNEKGASKVILVSIHANAFGTGNEWTTAKGWEVWTSPGETKADKLATFIYNRAKQIVFPGKSMRSDFCDGDPDKESKFYILVHTNCPAVLTENFFYTNKCDLMYMTSDVGRHHIVRTHVEGICDFINWLEISKKK
jgi:N-acetylmuramoyl-L-alanine amidase